MGIQIGSIEEFEAILKENGGVDYNPPPFNSLVWFITPKPADGNMPYKAIEFFTRFKDRVAVYRHYPRGFNYDDRYKHERNASLSEVLGLALSTRQSLPGTPIAQEVTGFAESMLKNVQASIGDLAARFGEPTTVFPLEPTET